MRPAQGGDPPARCLARTSRSCTSRLRSLSLVERSRAFWRNVAAVAPSIMVSMRPSSACIASSSAFSVAWICWRSLSSDAAARAGAAAAIIALSCASSSDAVMPGTRRCVMSSKLVPMLAKLNQATRLATTVMPAVAANAR